MLGEARESGLRLAIATTTSPGNVAALLNHTLGSDAVQWFESIAAGDVVSAKKPAPDIYFHVMRQLGVMADACMAIEDSRNGFLSARAAGLDTVITVNGDTRDQNFDGAALVIDHLGEPEKPFELVRGGNSGGSYVNVALLKKLHHDWLNRQVPGDLST